MWEGIKSKLRPVFVALYFIIAILISILLFGDKYEEVISAYFYEKENYRQNPKPPKVELVQTKLKFVYTIDGDHIEIPFPPKICAMACHKDLEKIKKFIIACKEAGFEAYRKPCCRASCTGKVN